MLTVKEAVQLKAFRGAQVVAGHKGLDKEIQWVHNAGAPDAADWLNGGELLLTTANNMPEDENGQRHYINTLIKRGVVGLALAIGLVVQRMPDAMCAIADKHGFPLIEIPYQLRFVDLARAANEQIAQHNMSMVRRALSIHQTLTRLVLEGGSIPQLASTLASLVNQSVSIENARFEAYASVNISAVDEARRYTQEYGHTAPHLVKALDESVLPEIRRTLRPVFIPKMPHVGLEMERILAPIVMHGEIYGYVWIIADDRPLSDLDHMAIESGATIAALMMFYQESVQNAEASLKGNLLARLIQGEMNMDNILSDQALRYGVDLHRDFHALLIDAGAQSLDCYRRVDKLISTEKYKAIVGQYAGQVIILSQEMGADLDNLLENIEAHTNGSVHMIGISDVNRGERQVRNAYSQCREVLDISKKLNQTSPHVYFRDLGYLHALYHAGPDALQGNPFVPALRELQLQHHADLFFTLETYLDAGGNGVSTAEILHIHRSTLNYRLQRITDICKADLSNPEIRVNLQIALKLLRLFSE